jgi:small-conductance mechanosensitive channel
MKARHWIVGFALLALVAAAILGIYWTRATDMTADNAGPKPNAQKGHPARRERLVDMRALLTARQLTLLATSPEEQEFVRQAEKLANHEVDLAFANAMRQAAEAQPPATPEIKALADAKDKAENDVEADQKFVKRLTGEMEAASGQQKENLGDQLDVAKAQLELDQDELDDASESLERAGGDPQARIQRLKAAHEAANKDPKTSDTAQTPEPVSRFAADSLVAKVRAWMDERDKQGQLVKAAQEAQDRIQRLEKWRDRVSQRVKQDEEQRKAAQASAAVFAKGGKTGAPSREAAKAALDSLKRFMADQRALSDLGKRIQDDQGLIEVYGNWAAVVETHEMAALHEVLKGLLVILFMLLGTYAVSLLVERLFGKLAPDNLRLGTLRTVAKIAVQALGVVLILFAILGVPSQTTTILGLAGAGLTVALKDFIVAFFGWFQLMGRNGIRVGDWVEIKGVGGEVAEIGLLRTVLLETGSWSDAGHPTGRRVSFVNSFAVEGHFFNFSTSGQWMWDELQVLLPLDKDPYPVIDGIQKLVTRKTEANAQAAEQEWQKATSRYRVKAFSAVPGINVVPTSGGIEIRVRYITRAYERHETRRELYQSILELMHGPREEGSESGGVDEKH